MVASQGLLGTSQDFLLMPFHVNLDHVELGFVRRPEFIQRDQLDRGPARRITRCGYSSPTAISFWRIEMGKRGLVAQSHVVYIHVGNAVKGDVTAQCFVDQRVSLEGIDRPLAPNSYRRA